MIKHIELTRLSHTNPHFATCCPRYMIMGVVSPIFFNITLYGGLVLMAAFVGYDTQRVIEDYK